MKEKFEAHFIGIGGAGMSAIARVLAQMGWSISGSDLKETRNTDRLRQEGITVFIGHEAANVLRAERVVVSSAIPPTNVELVEAKKVGLAVLGRAEMLGEIARAHRTVAVAGTHGKTTTTSMIGLALERAGLDPTILIGGELNDIGTNAKYGKGDLLVAEADESDGSLTSIDPTYVVLTNIELDHPDHYATYSDVEAVFSRYLTQVPTDGAVFYWADPANLRRVVERSGARGVGYGLTDHASLRAVDVSLAQARSRFDVTRDGENLGEVSLSVPGEHNVLNALAAIAVGLEVGVPFDELAQVLRAFGGAQRRFQSVGQIDGVAIVDDYAHHPTEVRATLSGAATGPWGRIVAIFQPHRYTRTSVLGRDFGAAFCSADMVIVTDVYGAGEEPIPGVSGKVIMDAVLEAEPRSRVAYIPRWSDAIPLLASSVRDGDLVLTMGAGDITQLGPELVGVLEQQQAAKDQSQPQPMVERPPARGGKPRP